MMGNNELVLNSATMVQALQLWADSVFKIPIVIDGVEPYGGGVGGARQWRVTTSKPPDIPLANPVVANSEGPYR